ncbi:PQQ-binding-like beta-propeller repeat protein [Streptomyces sp. TRM 70361]|uniref:outer membrane protein assembly factor BamB family protein n=1 Tax=Streptomyces sp. TRM 70361 TaxID=3116553 RepID=UPI002E7BE333|nr:PQQ-binding-like beta-propeller repeat protein [Streptomyces sp. TRM 70361]MEE1942827.1 PQQ-binding-like beta-propeller repeat protein [Streptomyces sp. TRM 70361]
MSMRHKRYLLASLSFLLAVLVGVAGSTAVAVPDGTSGTGPGRPGGPDRWAMGGHDLANSRSNPSERRLGPSNAGELAVKWTATAEGDVSATPAVVGGAVYYPDWGGRFWKVDARTGKVFWSRSVAEYTGIEGAVSRSSPAVVGDTVFIGTQQGARLLAVDTATGELRWSTPVDDHPYAILTQSPAVYGGVVYQGVSSDEETAAGDPDYPCCTFRGSVVATDAGTGEVLWKTYTTPEGEDPADGFSGAATWSGTPAIDPESGTVYITTGNNYTVPQSVTDCQEAGGTATECLPPENMINSFIAFDMKTGEVKWSTGQDRFDSWNTGCLPQFPPNNCPIIPGPDHDFGDGAHLFTLSGGEHGEGRKAVGAGQKSGEYWMLDATTGEVLWSSAVGPGGEFGGIQWGTATDGERIYFTETNINGLPYELPDGQTIDHSSFGALDPATGEILWQVPEPHQGTATAAVSVANGVLYASSLNNHMYAFDAATGELLWDFEGEGASAAGPAITGGTVYWGNGYARIGLGDPSRTFYAFSAPRRP